MVDTLGDYDGELLAPHGDVLMHQGKAIGELEVEGLANVFPVGGRGEGCVFFSSRSQQGMASTTHPCKAASDVNCGTDTLVVVVAAAVVHLRMLGRVICVEEYNSRMRCVCSGLTKRGDTILSSVADIWGEVMDANVF